VTVDHGDAETWVMAGLKRVRSDKIWHRERPSH
jgi:hypothetical protein